MREKPWEEILRKLSQVFEELKKGFSEQTTLTQGLKEEVERLKEKVGIFSQRLELIERLFREQKIKEKMAAILIDWDNLFNLLEELDLAFPGAILLEEIKQVLKEKIATAIIFYHKIPFLYSQALKRDGYWLYFCPPISLAGKDTVDETILETSKFIGEIEFIDTVVIISGDKDMIHPINWLLKCQKRVILVLLDRQSRTLRDKEEIIKIRLPSVSKPEIPPGENPYLRAIEIISQNRSCPIEDPTFLLFLAVLNFLPEKATLTEKRGFENLRDAIWSDIYPHLKELPELRGAGKRDIELILGSLLDYTDILRKVMEAKRRFYLFNPKSSFFPKVQVYIKEVLNQKPYLNPLFLRGR